MKIVSLVARILLGLIFSIFGLNGFLHFMNGPMPPGLAGEFIGAMFTSHFAYLVFGIQLAAGVLLLANQCVPFALVLLAAVIANILAFHITMLPAGIAPGIVAAVLWLLVAYQERPILMGLFIKKSS